MRLWAVDHVRFAFGTYEWGGHLIAVNVLGGAFVYSEKVRCLPPGSAVAAFLVAGPVYVHGLGSLAEYRIVGSSEGLSS